MKPIEEIYCDYLYDCHLANRFLTDEDWEFYGKEDHHVEIPDCEGGLLTPLNSQTLTTYQHWIAGILQSEIVGRKCFAMVPRGVLPLFLETLRVKWQTHHNRTANFQRKTGSENPMYGKNHTDETRRKMSEVRTGKTHSEETKRKIGEKHKGKKYGLETLQKMRENCFRVDGWVWITNGYEETMVPPESKLPESWRIGRKPITQETRNKLRERSSGSNNPMYGVEPKTKQMRWFKDLEQVVEKMFIPGEEPDGWVRGRLTALDRR